MEVSGIITLTSDFGLRDANVAAMKGVILGISPQARIVDLSHDVSPQDIAAAAYILWRGYPNLPKGTVHVVVVDPGVGSERRGLAIQASGHYFVAPDNGALTYILRDAPPGPERGAIIHLNKSQFWQPRVSNTFHGRDIFAPVAAHLSLGLRIEELGEVITDPLLLPVAEVKKEPGWIRRHILYIDRFGNLLTDIPEVDVLSLEKPIRVLVAGVEIYGLSLTFSAGSPGEIIAYIDSSWRLAIAQVQGSADRALGAKVGDIVEVRGG